MAAPDWQKLKEDAQDTLDNIDTDKLTKTSFQLLGACVAVLDHDEGNSVSISIAPTTEPYSASGSMPEHTGVLDDFSEVLKRYSDSRTAADRDIMRETLKWQLNEIERELVEMRHEVHDETCVQLFHEFRENIRLKI